MTKVSVLGEEPKEKELNKIEFLYYLDFSLKTKTEHREATLAPSFFKEVILISKNIISNFDLILAIDYNENNLDALYLGHWNDGIV